VAGNVITVYVDDASLRILVTSGKSIENWADLPLEPGLVKDGVVIDKTSVADKISHLLAEQSIEARKVIAGLSGLHCISRLLKIPRLSKSLQVEGITREAGRVIPVPLEKLYISWQVISTSQDEMVVFLVAFPRNVADAMIETLRLAGLDPYIMDLKPLALARVANTDTAIIADVQPTDIDIVVIVDRIPQLIRTLSLPHTVESWPGTLTTIKGEIDRTAKFYNSSHADSPLDTSVPILISGELAEHPQEYEQLAGDLGYTVMPLSSPLECPGELPSNKYMVNIGLALKEIGPSKSKSQVSLVNFNVLPDEYKPRQRSISEYIPVASIVVAAGLLAYLGFMVWNSAADVQVLNAELDNAKIVLEQKKMQAQLKTNEITQLENMVSDAEASRTAYKAALGYFERDATQVNVALGLVLRVLPNTVMLEVISYSNANLVIDGNGPDEEDVLEYARDLRAGERFREVVVTSLEMETGERVTFKFTLIE